MIARSVVALAIAALLAGCSRDGDDPARNVAEPAKVAGPPPTRVGSANSGLHAEVSALSADTSGLNVRITDTATIVDLPTDTLFEFDRAVLTSAATENLGKAADAIRRGAPGDLTVVGHTDGKGSGTYNQNLSERRAVAVADWMRQQVGVRQRTILTIGRGKTEPLVPETHADGSDDPAGRARNRRVEIVIPR